MAGSKRHGFFIPHRFADTTALGSYPAVERCLGAAKPTFAQWLAAANGFASVFASFSGPAPQPRFTQDWFPRLDAAIAYTLARSLAPRRIVEVGCGHSTRFLARAARDLDGRIEITCIDPEPRASLAQLGVRHLPRLLQDVDERVFAELLPGDFLFIDSSHVLMPGTDVDILYTQILPNLRPGVILHAHDVFLPERYPIEWSWRGYNEQAVLGALLGTGVLEPLFASRYVVTRMGRELAQTELARLPLLDGAYETSLWARVRSAPDYLASQNVSGR